MATNRLPHHLSVDADSCPNCLERESSGGCICHLLAQRLTPGQSVTYRTLHSSEPATYVGPSGAIDGAGREMPLLVTDDGRRLLICVTQVSAR